MKSQNTGSKERVLSRLSRRLVGFLGLKVVLILWSVIGLAALTVIVVDAVVVLSTEARVHAPVALLASAAIVALIGLLELWRLSQLRVARRFERADPSLGSQLTNAVQLSSQSSETSVGELLRLQTVALGRSRARRARTWPVVRGAVGISCAVALVTILLWGGGRLFFSDVLSAIVPRFLDPFGDHPPYSRLRIQVEPGDTEVLYGGQCEVRAAATGLPVEKLYLVALRKEKTTKTIMFVAPDRTFFQTVVNLRDETQYYVTDGRARSHRHKIRIRHTPQITMLEVKTEFPSYTGMPARGEQLTGEALRRPVDKRLPLGTRLTFRVASNRPLASGTIALTPIMGGEKKTIPLGRDRQETVVKGAFALTEAIAFTISVTDVDGLVSTEPRRGRVTILPDRPPRLSVLQPGRNAVATPNVVIPVRVQAEDDYAVTRLIWFRSLNQSIERPHDMKLQAKKGTGLVEATGALDLGKLGVRPGDVIEYFFEAVDNYPQGPNIATSRIFSIRIISMKEYQEILRQAAARRALFQTYQALGNWLRRLAERAQALEKKARQLAKKGGGSPAEQAALRKEAAELAAEMARYRQALGRALKQPKLFDIEGLFRKNLAQQDRMLQRLRKQLAGSAAAGVPSGAVLERIAKGMASLSRSEQAQIGEPLRHLIPVARLIARAQTFVRLALEQKEVVRLATRFKDRDEKLSVVEQRELEELGRRERKIRSELLKLLTELPELLEELPPEETYDRLREGVTSFIKGVLAVKIPEDLDQAGRKFLAHDGKRGYPPARDALEKMNKFITRMRARSLVGLAKQCLAFNPALVEMLGNSLGQILSAMAVGYGPAGQDGYGLYGSSVMLYGPNAELAGDQASGGRDLPARERGKHPGRAASGAPDPHLRPPGAPAPVKLQRDAKFPLRYRNLVGEYFRAVAESQSK